MLLESGLGRESQQPWEMLRGCQQIQEIHICVLRLWVSGLLMTELDHTWVIYRKPYNKIGEYWHGSADGNWGLACVIIHITLDKALVCLGFSQQEPV